MAATGTSLGRVTRVDANNHAPLGFRLVGEERPELGEAPGMQATARFPATLLGAASDARQILHDYHGAGLDGLDDAPAQNVVAVAPEAVDLPGQLAEVPLGRAGAFALKTATEPEVPAFDLLPAAFTEEAVVGADGMASKAHVHPYYRSGWTELDIRKCHDDMEPECPSAPDQVRAVEVCGLVHEAASIGIGDEGDLEPTSHRGQAYEALAWPKRVCSRVVADRREHGARAGRLAAFLLAGKGRFQCLRRSHSGRNYQLGRKAGVLLPQGAIGCMVQPNAVLLRMFPAVGRHCIEAGSMLPQRLQKRSSLLSRWFEPKANGPPHIHMISYFQKGGKGRRLLPMPEGRGLRAATM
ncbi:MAG: hypothetical protein QXZ09_03510 [Candidatus Methanomethylicaceae archaeon]